MCKNISSEFFELVENPLGRGTLAKFESSLYVWDAVALVLPPNPFGDCDFIERERNGGAYFANGAGLGGSALCRSDGELCIWRSVDRFQTQNTRRSFNVRETLLKSKDSLVSFLVLFSDFNQRLRDPAVRDPQLRARHPRVRPVVQLPRDAVPRRQWLDRFLPLVRPPLVVSSRAARGDDHLPRDANHVGGHLESAGARGPPYGKEVLGN
jgi:hypothetical protein